tara:strand:+ start:228 stop:476 length:249 start_codon:yes stop_codon:yes gene_type:complete
MNIKEYQLVIGLCAIGLGIYLGLTNDDHRGNFVTGFMENSVKEQENIRTEFDACMEYGESFSPLSLDYMDRKMVFDICSKNK